MSNVMGISKHTNTGFD